MDRSGNSQERDEEGLAFSSIEAAQLEALLAAREILVDKAIRGDLSDDEVFEITSEDGTIVSTLPFRASADID